MTAVLQELIKMKSQKQNIPSLSGLVDKQFRHRILFVFAVIFLAASVMTTMEVAVSLKQFKQKIKLEAGNLQSLVMSEIMVGRESIIANILEVQNKKEESWIVTWDRNYKESTQKFIYRGLFNVEFVYPLQLLNGPVYGALIFSSHFLSQPEILDILLSKLFLMLFIFLTIALALLPLAKKIPTTLILQPMQKIIDSLEKEDFDIISNENIPYQEILHIEEKLKKICSDKRRFEDERVEVQKMTSAAQTAQMLAHDIKKPMTLVHAVLCGLEVIKDPEAIKTFAVESKLNVKKACDQMNHLFKELTLLKQASCTNFTLGSIKEIIDEVVFETKLIFEHRAYDLLVDASLDLQVEVDICSFKRALSNLLSNAIEASPDGSKIWIKALQLPKHHGDCLKLLVGNSGSYISEEERSKVFQLFYTAGKSRGSGLGLAIVQQILRTHHGHIWVESSQEYGTEFIFEMPLKRALTTPEKELLFEKPSASRNLSDPLTVLVVDDQEFDLYLAKKTLKEFNPHIKVITCGKSKEAVALATKAQFDLIITDIKMGKDSLDGFELTENLRKKGVQSFIYVHTSGIEKDNAELASQVGANLFGIKPLLEDQVKTIAEKMLMTH